MPDTPHPDSTLRRIFLLLTLAAAGMAALLALLPAAGHDQLWFLLMARRWLAGATLYGPEIFDSNPPGIVWLSAIPVLLSKALHLPTTTIAKLLVTLLETATSALSYFLLKPGCPRSPLHGDRGIPPSLNAHTSTTPPPYELPALLFAAITLFYVVPARDFGQRDHMAAFLILPYVLAAAIPFQTPRLTRARTTAALLAAIAICLKPHHALIPIAIELTLLLTPKLVARSSKLKAGQYLLSPAQPSNLTPPTLKPLQTPSRRQLLRPEPILLILFGLAFLVAIHHLAPLYFTTALPIVRDTYWAIGHLSLPALALEAIELLILAAISLTLYLRTTPRSPVVRLLLIAASAATLAYFLQGTGWYYQQLPAISLFGIALTLQLLDIAATKPLRIPTWLTPTIAALSILALALTTHFTNYPFTEDRAFALINPDPTFFTALPPDTPIAILTTSVDAAMMPTARYHLTWAQRTNNLWLLPAILRSETPGSGAPPRRTLTPARISELDALQHRWMVEDLTRWRPQLILIHRCQKPHVTCQELEGRDDDLLAWFTRDPAFAALWSHYAYTDSRGEFDAYTLKP